MGSTGCFGHDLFIFNLVDDCRFTATILWERLGTAAFHVLLWGFVTQIWWGLFFETLGGGKLATKIPVLQDGLERWRWWGVMWGECGERWVQDSLSWLYVWFGDASATTTRWPADVIAAIVWFGRFYRTSRHVAKKAWIFWILWLIPAPGTADLQSLEPATRHRPHCMCVTRAVVPHIIHVFKPGGIVGGSPVFIRFYFQGPKLGAKRDAEPAVWHLTCHNLAKVGMESQSHFGSTNSMVWASWRAPFCWGKKTPKLIKGDEWNFVGAFCVI